MYKNARAWTYDMRTLGFRYHMSNMHAAIGLSQLAKMPEIEKSRRDVCRFYNSNLGCIKELKVPKTDFNDVVPFLYYGNYRATIGMHYDGICLNKVLIPVFTGNLATGLHCLKMRKGDLSLLKMLEKKYCLYPFTRTWMNQTKSCRRNKLIYF